MEFIPEVYNNCVVLNVLNSACNSGHECSHCLDIGGMMHNWLMQTELKYLVFDLQDEKDVCPTFLIEMIQLQKRQRLPVLFIGVLEKAQKVLDSYFYTAANYPTFRTPDEATSMLQQQYKPLLILPYTNMEMGKLFVLNQTKTLDPQLRTEEEEEVITD